MISRVILTQTRHWRSELRPPSKVSSHSRSSQPPSIGPSACLCLSCTCSRDGTSSSPPFSPSILEFVDLIDDSKILIDNLGFDQLKFCNLQIKRSSESSSPKRPPLQPGTSQPGNPNGALHTASGEGAGMLTIGGAASHRRWALCTALPFLAQKHCMCTIAICSTK